MDSRELAGHVNAAMHLRGWTIRKMAEESGVNESTIRAWLRGDRPKFTLDAALRIASALELKPFPKLMTERRRR